MDRKIAVIVGVGPGLGWALVKRFAREGYAAVACSREPRKVEPLAKADGVSARFEACDVTRAEDVARVFSSVQRDLGPDSLLPPDAIAEAYWQLHRQPRGAWTHELDLRPWVEKF